MKILRVIVDELPKSCRDCQFERGGGCAGFGMYPMTIILIEQNETKPSWCPLAVENNNNRKVKNVD